MKIALHGGKPVRDSMLPYGRQIIEEEDVRAVVRALKSDWLTTGPAVEEFERAFARAVHAPFAVAVSSGTAALHLALLAAGIGPGDEVVTTPLTFAATCNTILLAGAKPVFADVEEDTLNLDPAEIERSLGPRTKALLPVDFTGRPCRHDAIREIAGRAGCVVIEDAAHSLGASFGGKPVGSFADLTTFSFHPVKHITTGEGGMVTTGDERLAARLRRRRNHGIERNVRPDEPWYYEIRDVGLNYRLSDFQCALGTAQVAKLDRLVARRREIAAFYEEALRGLPLRRPAPDPGASWHLYVVRLELPRLKTGRGEIFKALRAENISVQVNYVPVHWFPVYQALGYRKGSCPRAEAAYEDMLTLPLWSGMSDRDAADVVEAVRRVAEAYAA